MNITKSAVLLVAGMATLTVACSNAGTSLSGNAAPSSKVTESNAKPTTTAQTATDAESVVSTSAATDNTGAIVVKVSDLDGAGLNDIAVTASRVGPCDPSHFEMPAVDGFVEKLHDRTDRSGTVVFERVTLGCWSVAATVPAGFSRVEATRTAVFLVDGGDTSEADLKLQRGMTEPCNGDSLFPAMGTKGDEGISIDYCDGSWALVSAQCGSLESCTQGPIDNTRILRVAGDRWATYTTLPSTTCLSTAKHDGVPTTLRVHFNANC